MLDVLIALQIERDLDDKPFAATLGVTREHWNRIRHEKSPLTAKVVQAALRSYPTIREEASLFLLGDDNKLSEILRKTPSNIDAAESERTHTLVLTQRETIACAQTETAPTEQGKGGSSVSRGVPRQAGKGYVMSRYDASAQASRAADAEAG